MNNSYVRIYDKKSIEKLTRKREGEVKLGECVQVLNDSSIDDGLKKSSAKFVLIGLPEDIGVRANFGRGGAHTAWQPALSNILNTQSNEFFNGDELLVLGHIDFDDLIKLSYGASVDKLRELVSIIDERVVELIKTIVANGKIPIIIGGGHNNSYGNIKGAALGLKQAGKIKTASINCINSDAHTDFRSLEGRHSGNGFSYAFNQNYLNRYAIIGLHQTYNSQAVLNELKKHQDKIYYNFFEDVFIKEEYSFKHAVMQGITFTDDTFCGIELDMDTVQNIPSSAKTSSGISANQARQYVTWCAQHTNAAYLHIAEAAPVLSHIKTDNKTGKLIAYLVTDFIKNCKHTSL